MSQLPNIVFFLIDDLGWVDLGCYGSSFYETPHIDALAADSMLFTDAYASCPVCSPTRASIMSGKYPARLGITNYIDWRGQYHPLRGRLVDVPYKKELPQTEVSIARALKEEGYRTYHVGKWHLGGPGFYPDDHGFDVNIAGCEWGMPVNGYFSPWQLPTLSDEVDDGTYLTDYLTDRAIELIQASSDKPFYLNMSYYSVHTPIQAKESYIQKYRDKLQAMGLPEEPDSEIVAYNVVQQNPDTVIRRRLTQSYPEYAAMIEILDENIGRLIQALKDSDQYENTIIVFTSDNGGLATNSGSKSDNNCGVTCNAPLKNGKAWMSDGGVRVSQFIRWPGHTQAGDRCSTPVTSTDFYPTLLEMVGATARPQQHCDGVSICPLLDKRGGLDRSAIFWHFPHYHQVAQSPGSAVRKGYFKLIEYYDTSSYELYNLAEDISEEHDLSETHNDILEELKTDLMLWKKSICAEIPQKNPDWDPLQFDPYDPSNAFV